MTQISLADSEEEWANLFKEIYNHEPEVQNSTNLSSTRTAKTDAVNISIGVGEGEAVTPVNEKSDDNTTQEENRIVQNPTDIKMNVLTHSCDGATHVATLLPPPPPAPAPQPAVPLRAVRATSYCSSLQSCS